MARIIIDIGNTTSKVAVMDGQNCNIVWQGVWIDCEVICEIENQMMIEHVGLTAVGRVDIDTLSYLRDKFKERFFVFDYNTPIPIKNLYQSKKTLGSDRILAAIGANSIFKNKNILVIDFGSAITIDVITENGEYLGGNISPGVGLRFKSLNEHTENLPLCGIVEKMKLYGENTNEAIAFGVINGIINEVEGYIKRYKQQFDNLEIVFVGGDADYFADKLEETVFVYSKLVLIGLNCVIDYNVEKE